MVISECHFENPPRNHCLQRGPQVDHIPPVQPEQRPGSVAAFSALPAAAAFAKCNGNICKAMCNYSCIKWKCKKGQSHPWSFLLKKIYIEGRGFFRQQIDASRRCSGKADTACPKGVAQFLHEPSPASGLLVFTQLSFQLGLLATSPFPKCIWLPSGSGTISASSVTFPRAYLPFPNSVYVLGTPYKPH